MPDYHSFAVAPVMHGELILSPAQKKTLNAYLQKHEGQQVRITLSQPTRGRSNHQSRYMWGVVYQIIAAETGHSTTEIHEYCKATFLQKSFITLAGREVEIAKSTTTLSTNEMEDYLTAIRSFAAQELGITVPLPHEGM
jgi:hypothetical protein